jgi:hypothetical protein
MQGRLDRIERADRRQIAVETLDLDRRELARTALRKAMTSVVQTIASLI